MNPDFSRTTLEAAQANTLAAVTLQVANLNDGLLSNFMTAFGNYSQSVLAGRPPKDPPPQPPKAYVVGYFVDPTSGPGANGPYGPKEIQWAYPSQTGDPVCAMPPIPKSPAPPAPLPERDDIRNVPLNDTLPVGFKMVDPVTGHVYQKQASPTPFGVAYFYLRVA